MGQSFERISDIGAGINYKKKGLQEFVANMKKRMVQWYERNYKQ